mgnify:CR=1 FL=1
MEAKIKAIIVDDEQEARDILSNLLLKFPEVEILDKLSNVDDGITSFLKYRPDIVFLDVQMPKKSGFDFIHEVNSFNINSTIIFTTAYNEYAIEALRHSAFDFLLKPVNRNELQNAINRYKAKSENDCLKSNIEKLFKNLSGINKIKLNTREGYIFIDPDKIFYLEAEGNYTHIFCDAKKVIATLNLGKIEEMLDGNQFQKISRSVIINVSYLSSIDRKKRTCCLELPEKTIELHISKTHLKNFVEG